MNPFRDDPNAAETAFMLELSAIAKRAARTDARSEMIASMLVVQGLSIARASGLSPATVDTIVELARANAGVVANLAAVVAGSRPFDRGGRSA